MPELARVLRLEALCHLGEAGVPGDERRAPRSRGLRGDHAERLREDRRHDARVREREQVHEVAVLEGAREERLPGVGDALELSPVVAEADDHRTRVHPSNRLEEHVDALVLEELAEVDDGRRVAGEECLEPLGVSLVRQSLVGVPRVGRVAPGLFDEPGERLGARTGPPLLDVHSRRDLVHALDVAADLLEDLADVRRPDEDGRRPGEHLSPPRLQLRPAAHRVLELGAVRLHGVGSPGRRPDRAAEQDVVAEEEVRGKPLPHRCGVRLDPAVKLLPGAVVQEPDPVSRVAILDEDGEQAAHVRPHDLGSSEVVALCVALLREDDDVVALPRPLARELARVDVRPRSAEQVPVPDEDAHHPHPAERAAAASHSLGGSERTPARGVRSGGSRGRREGRRPGSTCGR